jgi:hypothetical protein
MLLGWEDRHVHTDFGHDRLRPGLIYADDAIQLLDLFAVRLALLGNPLTQSSDQLLELLEMVPM